MSILAAIKREQKKVRKQLTKLQNQLNGLVSAAEALGNSTNRQVNRELKGAKKRVLSAAGRAAIGKAARRRWAKVRAHAVKVAG
jgi:DNA anti-recombination protein RmuC